MELGARLKTLRESKHLKQEDIRKEFSLSGSSYSQYESNKRRPSYELLVKLADFYDVSLDYLLGRSDTYHPASPLRFNKYNKYEVEIMYMIHEMDSKHQENIYDYTSYIYDQYKKDAANYKKA